MRATPLRGLLTIGLLTTIGCGDDPEPTPWPTSTPNPTPADLDQDGYAPDYYDCDDTDKNVNLYAAEILDGKDNNCDGRIDEHTDAFDDDGDGFSEQEGDCNDNDSAVTPDKEDLRDGIDNDCDGVIDEDAGASGPDGELPTPSDLGTYEDAGARLVLYNDEAEGPTQSAVLGPVSWLGDLDGDGFDDFVAAQMQGDGGGRAFLFYGKEGGHTGLTSLQSGADATVVGYANPNQTGMMALGEVDLNGDGQIDLVIGDPRHREVGVFFGGRRLGGETPLDTADVRIRAGVDSGFSIGRFVAAGDFNGDGLDDLAISQPDYDYGAGRIVVFHGRPSWAQALDITQADGAFYGTEGLAFAGFGLMAPGDLDNDGFDELLITSSLEEIAPWTDTNGDGQPDSAGLYGRLSFFPGRAEGWFGSFLIDEAPFSLVPSTPTLLNPVAMASGDLDNDGHLDLALGLPYDTTDSGAVLLRWGGQPWPTGELSFEAWANLTLTGVDPETDLNTGYDLDIGDMNGDGFADLAVVTPRTSTPIDAPEVPGAPQPSSLPRPGYIALYPGTGSRPDDAAALAADVRVIVGSYGSLETIWALDLGGDNNGDGATDLLVGSQYYPYDEPTTAVMLFEGLPAASAQ